ncbi:hypothetical protein NDN08_001530 [Rhodosorus marinus]|uniref:Nuclear condensin complex subunit 3 C-terminal domain-containing protein n=1 Tax=Rhodosorus marinus TaxID=101924 RepID=A0AAV8UV77_9RHOD|nr:hypothetical protein NDN08_001530 [Rhodosorus marinus]
MEAQIRGAVFSALNDAQRSFASHHDACSTLAKACITDAVVFWKYTIQALNRVLVIYSRDPPVERLVEFFSKFAVYLSSKESNPEDKMGNEQRDACTTFMRYLIHHTSASSKAVRFRTTQILSRILVNLPEQAEISETVWEQLLEKMTSRSRDRLPRVRSAAVPGLCRLQSCIESDEIRGTVTTLLESDSSPLVRKTVLDNLSPEQWNIELILNRTSDTSEDVRRACYKVLAEKIDLQSLTISQRVTLLRRGRLDRSSHVRKEFLQNLVYRGWLEGSCDGDFYRLCELLDPETYSEDIVPILCEVEERCAKPIVALDVNHLTREGAVLLSAFAKQCEESERLSQVFPSLKSYAECLKYYKHDDFILSCLIQVFDKLDLSDEAGRRDLISTLQKDFLEDSQIPDRHYPGLVRALVSSMGSQSSVAGLVAELLIADGSDGSSEQATFRALKIVEGLLLASRPQNDPEVFFSSLIDNVVLKGLVNPSVDLRSVAIRCLSMYCLLDKTEKTASRNAPLFLQVLDNDVLQLQLIALEAIVDILMVHEMRDDVDGQSQRQMLIVSLTNCAGSTEAELRTTAAEGIAKLVFSRRIPSEPGILVRLILLFCNPISADDVRLRQSLSVFFPAFAASRSSHRLCVEECFMPTIQVLMKAPETSPLRQLDISQVGHFLLELTNPNAYCTKRTRASGNHASLADADSMIHSRIALKLINGAIDDLEGDTSEFLRPSVLRILNGVVLPSKEQAEGDAAQVGQDLLNITRKAKELAESKPKRKHVANALSKFYGRLLFLKVHDDNKENEVSKDGSDGVSALIHKTENLSILGA